MKQNKMNSIDNTKNINNDGYNNNEAIIIMMENNSDNNNINIREKTILFYTNFNNFVFLYHCINFRSHHKLHK